MTREGLLGDLAYARSLAEEGRHAPLIGGGFLVLFGVLLAITWTAHWALMAGYLGALPASAAGFLWIGFGIAAAIGVQLVSAGVRNKPGATSIGNRIDRAVWHAAVGAILAVIVGTMLAAMLRGERHAPDAIMAASFGFYGIALTTTATIAGVRWLGGFGVLAFVSSAVLWGLNSEPWAYLIAAGAAVLVLIFPGLLIMRREPSAIV